MSPPADIARSHVVARELENRLLGAFKKAGWRAELEPAGIEGQFRPDMVVRRGSHRYVVELKVAREPRRALLQAMLADAILQARLHARELHASPLAVVAAPRISPLAAQESASTPSGSRRMLPGGSSTRAELSSFTVRDSTAFAPSLSIAERPGPRFRDRRQTCSRISVNGC